MLGIETSERLSCELRKAENRQVLTAMCLEVSDSKCEEQQR